MVKKVQFRILLKTEKLRKISFNNVSKKIKEKKPIQSIKIWMKSKIENLKVILSIEL